MQVKNIEGLTPRQIQDEVNNGGKFVFFYYTISVVLMTFRRTSDIYFIKSGEKASGKALPYTLMSVFLGWWGIPWGPIYTVQSLSKNFSGGKDVTDQVLSSVLKNAAEATA